MKHIDAVRGYQRDILFQPTGYSTTGGSPLTECVIETVESDWQGHAPVLSLRFYHKPTDGAFVRELEAHGHQHYDEETTIGVEINLGPELANSLIDQLRPKMARVFENKARCRRGRPFRLAHENVLFMRQSFRWDMF